MRLLNRYRMSALQLFFDERSQDNVELAMVGSFLLLLMVALLIPMAFGYGSVSTTVVLPAAGSFSQMDWERNNSFAERHYPINELSAMWALDRGIVTQLVKDEPGTIKLRQGRKKRNTTYRVPESVARSIHERYWDSSSSFSERHFTLIELAEGWRIGRETARLLFRFERGVFRQKFGQKKARAVYSVPESVARRIHTRLQYPA